MLISHTYRHSALTESIVSVSYSKKKKQEKKDDNVHADFFHRELARITFRLSRKQKLNTGTLPE